MFYKKPKIYKNYIEDWESTEQIIVCKNGVFKRNKVNSLCYITRKTSFSKLGINDEEICYDNIGDKEIELEEKPYMKKKIPKGVLDTILRYYQVFAKKSLEVKLNVWYDKKLNEFIIDSPFQINSSVTVSDFAFDHPGINWTTELKERYPDKVILKEKRKAREIEFILDTHSHHVMSCSFSSTDDNADYYTAVGYKLFGVYKNVLEYPTMDLRYFLSPYGKTKDDTSMKINVDEVSFCLEDIVDMKDTSCKNYDLNKFADTIISSEKELY